jgi:hypothetical protein
MQRMSIIVNTMRVLLLLCVLVCVVFAVLGIGVGLALSGSNGTGAVLSLGLLLVVALLVGGVFMWKRANWARILTLAYAILLFLAATFVVVRALQLGPLRFAAIALVPGCIGLLGIYLFGFNKSVKALFGGKQ